MTSALRAGSPGARPPVGVVLAGGLGRRIGGGKAMVELCGQPLIAYPLRALRSCVAEVAIVAKADTVLPEVPGVSVWLEPDEPRHPLAGIVRALALAQGRSVLAVAADMPFVPVELLLRLVRADDAVVRPGVSSGASGVEVAAAVTPVCRGHLQPFPALYRRAAAGPLGTAARGGGRLVTAVGALSPQTLPVDWPEAFFSVNAPEDLLRATAILEARGGHDDGSDAEPGDGRGAGR